MSQLPCSAVLGQYYSKVVQEPQALESPGDGGFLQEENEDSWAPLQTDWIRISVDKAQKSLFVTGTPGDSYVLCILKFENHCPNS